MSNGGPRTSVARHSSDLHRGIVGSVPTAGGNSFRSATTSLRQMAIHPENVLSAF